jgi:hypothetical protein
VAKNLTRQAGLGWPGAFQPWRRTRSYVYCVSAVLANQQERDKLQSAIRTCFEALPADQRPPIEAIRILDWGDLRHWLDTLPRVADGWLGTSLPLVLSHGEYCASLTGFRRYLRPEVLPFIAPEEGANTQPEAILSRLEALAGSGGVLLKGVGGVGKTRTALEVGHRAEAKGWRVLHALPGEPGVTVEEIGEVLLSGSAPTLLVFDYLDQMPNLDLGSLLGRLLPEAQRRGIRLALLANMRPAALRQGNGARETLFKKENWLSLEPSAQQKLQINDSVLDGLGHWGKHARWRPARVAAAAHGGRQAGGGGGHGFPATGAVAPADRRGGHARGGAPGAGGHGGGGSDGQPGSGGD